MSSIDQVRSGPSSTEASKEARPRFRGINSIYRALTIMEIMVQRREPMGVSELARLMKLDPATVHRILATLLAAGWVYRDHESRRYHVALKVAHLGALVRQNDYLCDTALPALKKLSADYGETAHLATLDGPEVLFLAHETAQHVLVVNVDLLSRGPAYCMAVGKAILGAMSPLQVEVLLADVQLEPYTSHTRTSLCALLKDLRQVRQLGYAVDDEEYTEGVRCVAAPISNATGKPVASIGLTGPSVRVTPERIPLLGKAVVEAAQRITTLLGPNLAGREETR
jgi:DNA-binding IclR family transcriptional regulator